MSGSAALAAQPIDTEPLTRQNFTRLAAFIQDYSGIKMPVSKRTMLEGRLRRRLRSTKFVSINDYCNHLFDDGGLEQDIVHLIDAVTTNKTEFFREPAHFDFLKKVVLPALAQAGRRTIKVWSAAASTGMEPYTLAMVLEEFCEARRNISYSLLGTDLCTQVLAQAVAGFYPRAAVQPVPMEMRRRFLMQPRDPRRDEVRIIPRLRAKLAVARLNLMDQRYPVDADIDVIFCRNILIYFDKPTQAQVLRRLCDHIRPGGYLFLGHSEAVVGDDLPLDSVAATVFQRR